MWRKNGKSIRIHLLAKNQNCDEEGKMRMKIPGLTFSLKRALGVTKVKQSISRKTGIPMTKQGLERKIGGAVIKAITKKK